MRYGWRCFWVRSSIPWCGSSDGQFPRDGFLILCTSGARAFCVLPKGRQPEDPHIILARRIPGFQARVVKEAVYLVLQSVFEGLFLTGCHGFRPARGFHTAMQDLRHWTKVSHFIKLTVRAAPELLAKTQASEALKDYVDDELLQKLVQRMLETGHINFQWKTPVRRDGSLQGVGLSFLWTNIYFHQFDNFAKQELQKYNKDMRRLQYVRHAGNVLVGFNGEKISSCEKFYAKLTRFLEARQGLAVDPNRSGITHYTKIIDYLGFGISFKPVIQSESYKGEIHLERLKKACERLIQTRRDHLDRVNRYYHHAISQAIGIALKEIFDGGEKTHSNIVLSKELEEDVYFDRLRMVMRRKTRRKTTVDEARWIVTNSLKILAGLKDVLQRSKHQDPYNATPSSTLLNELASRVLPKELIQANLQIDNSLKAFYAKVLSAQRTARIKLQVDPALIENMSTGTIWFSSVDLLAPIDELKKLLEEAGFFKRGKETHKDTLFRMTDEGIVLLYAEIALSILKYYRCSNNLAQVRLLVNYNLRYSCLLTLAGKYEKSLAWTIERYTKDLLIEVDEEDFAVVIRPFPSRKQVLSMKHGFFMRPSPTPPWELLKQIDEVKESVNRMTSNRSSRWGGNTRVESTSPVPNSSQLLPAVAAS